MRLEGVLRVEFDHRGGTPGSRMRIIYLARALNDFEPLKTIPDEDSLGAVRAPAAALRLEHRGLHVAVEWWRGRS